MNGGRFDFDDGGTYCGGWEDGKAHGHGVCTGPKGQGEYSGAWHYGFEVSGVYTWPSGNCYEGQWQNGKRHGLGAERRGRWVYRGEWNQGYKGRYGVRQSANSQAKYEGTWANGLQDGYGTETYADVGTYQGQWLRGMRHGYGTRHSAQYGVAARYRSRSQAHDSLSSLRSEPGADENATGVGKEKGGSRGGFVLRAKSELPSRRRSLSEKSGAFKRTILQGLRITKQRSAGDINQKVAGGTGGTPKSIRSSGSTASCASDESAMTGYNGHEHGSLIGAEEFVEPNAKETYMGEWKSDKRSGVGVSERSDGLKYEGEWFNNKKFGYGVTTFKDGTKEEGKYKNNVLITSQRRKNVLFVRSSKLRERIDAAVSAASRAAQIAVQKSDISISRSVTARERADQADLASLQAREDSGVSRLCAKQFAPDFYQPGADILRKRQQEQMGNHKGAIPNDSARSISVNIPHHIGTSFDTPGDSPADSVQRANAVLASPMYTPPEEPNQDQADWDVAAASVSQRPVDQQLRPRDLFKQAAFEEQASLASLDDAVISDAPVIMTVHGPGSAREGLTPHCAVQAVTVRQYPATTNSAQVDGEFRVAEARPAVSPRLDYVMNEAGWREQYDQTGRYPRSPQMINAGRSPNIAASGRSPNATTSRTPSLTGSLNQVPYDHFDQYRMAANPSAAKLARANFARQQRSLRKPPTTERDSSPSGVLIRRTTLASSTDWRGMPQHASNTTRFGRIERTLGEGTSAFCDPAVNVQATSGSLEPMGRRKGSMLDTSRLEQIPVTLSREEAARLSSQRRQELQRMKEEAELLRSNPLRYVRYLYHPSVRAWLIRWKLPLIILLLNFGLSILFYNLLTYSKGDSHDA